MYPTYRSRQVATVTGNKTLTAADSGIVQNVTATATITLPATALGLSFIVRNGANNGDATVTVAPAAADGITGNGFTATVNKAAINTNTTAQAADELRLVGTGTTGVTGWVAQDVVGTWVRQP